jgi:hypothetical protein
MRFLVNCDLRGLNVFMDGLWAANVAEGYLS